MVDAEQSFLDLFRTDSHMGSSMDHKMSIE